MAPPTQPGIELGSWANEEAEAQGSQLTCSGPVAGELTSLEPQARALPQFGVTGSGAGSGR